MRLKVGRFIQRHHLVRPGQHVLVAVSGGADSVALLHVLKELAPSLKLRLTVAHLNHKIRGRAAEADAKFVRQLARSLGLDFICRTAAGPPPARRKGISLEMAGRKARYSFFEKAALSLGCDAVATAHTADDNAETILLMLLRGCGLPGLTGIAPSAEIGTMKVIRPLLGAGRAEIEKYLRERKINWREDLSNRDLAFTRNRVRHELLPLLEAKYNRKIKEALNRLSVLLREENDLMDGIAEKAYTEAACAKTALSGRPASSRPAAPAPFSGPELNLQNLTKNHIAVRRRVLRRWLLENGLKAERADFQLIDRIDDLIMRPETRGKTNLSGGLEVWKNYPRLAIETRRKKFSGNYRIRIKIPGTTVLPAGLRMRAKTGHGIHRERAVFGEYPVLASVSLQKWRGRPIWARNWRPGDRMRPFGMNGTKKIQDIFSDAKVPAELRRTLPILDCGGEIVWVPGHRIARGWEVAGPAANALHLSLEKNKRG